MAKQSFEFQAEVGRLLDIVAHALYSHKEIFLRELVSNASDAADRLRYAALTDASLMEGGGEIEITIEADKKARTLTVSDNGIGMSRDELASNLGTIARSGTQAFVSQLTGDAKKDMALIGQFGVGFYSAFMVAESVAVVTRRAGADEAWRWSSDGKGAFTIEEAKREGRGTTVTLHLAKGEDEFLDDARLAAIVKAYSDHIAIPIVLWTKGRRETLNIASALWTRPKGEITEEQYREFYHHVGHTTDEPYLTLHNAVEGVLSYTSLLFVPSHRPFDLFDPERKPRIKLYVKRVFITDDCEDLLPSYLRFLRGIVDSEDLTLNVSREMLQRDPKLARIRKGLTKRVLGELEKAAKKDGYAAFWENFGAVLKEGIYEDAENREALLDLARFRSTEADGLTSLADYVVRMKEGQKAIYFLGGEDADALGKSPHLEGFKARGLEVLLLADAIDEFWVPAVGQFRDKPFQSVTRGAADLGDFPLAEDAPSDKEGAKAEEAARLDPLLAAFKQALAGAVKDVRASERLTESAVCLVADAGDLDINLERLLKRAQRLGGAETPRILEVNPRHALIRSLARRAAAVDGDAPLADAAWLLLDQARIQDGEPVTDAAAFARRLAAVMEKALVT